MKIIFAGEGGQGVQVIAEILAKAAFWDGQPSLYIPNFGVEQRGGVSLAFVVIDQTPIAYPKFEHADLAAIFSDRSYQRVKSHLDAKTKIILSPAMTKTIKGAIKLPAQDLPYRSWNILILGEINRQGKLASTKNLIKAMEERFARQYAKNPALQQINLKALNYA